MYPEFLDFSLTTLEVGGLGHSAHRHTGCVALGHRPRAHRSAPASRPHRPSSKEQGVSRDSVRRTLSALRYSADVRRRRGDTLSLTRLGRSGHRCPRSRALHRTLSALRSRRAATRHPAIAKDSARRLPRALEARLPRRAPAAARDFDLGGVFQHSGNYPMVFLHSAAPRARSPIS